MSKPFEGSSRRLVIAFDCGTTFSGLSYCLLNPGEVPKICNITRYPGQEHKAGASKIPSIICYDKQGKVRAAGAEVLLPENVEAAEEEEWVRAEWFKVRMRPKSMPIALKSSTLPPLPPNKTVTQIFADFLEYLTSCAEKFIKETHATVARKWDELKSTAVYVIGHPNGWEGSQQSKLRQAAILGKLVPDTLEGRSRIKFVSEGEASLHFCLREGVIDKEDKGFIIADLGGGTLDFSAYRVTGTAPIQAEEVAAAICKLEGSTMVTRRARGFIKHKLRDSRYGSDDHVKQISDCFDDTTKKQFRTVNDVCHIVFGSIADKDPQHGITSGRFKLAGAEVAAFFDPALTETVASIRQQIKESKTPISTVYLVGGFSANSYVMTHLKEKLASHGIAVASPDGQTAKAVADGGLSFYLDQYVSSRIAKVSYGTKYHWIYEPKNPAHRRRKANIWTRPSGQKLMKGGFRTVLKKGTSVSKETEFRSEYGGQVANVDDIGDVQLDLRAYIGPGDPPEWLDEIEKSNLRTLCNVAVSKAVLKKIVRRSVGQNGTVYWWYNYDLVIHFGGTEMTAQIVWMEDGVEYKTPARIVYDDPEEPDEAEEEESQDDWHLRSPPARDTLAN